MIVDTFRGTQMRVYWPTLSPSLRSSEFATNELHGQSELVLVVDDDLAVQQATQAVLEYYHYTTIVACDGVEAIAAYAKQPESIRVVLTDIMMPNSDGITLIRALQRINSQVKVIATSGISTQKSPVLDAGASVFLSKPYPVETLLRHVSVLVREPPST